MLHVKARKIIVIHARMERTKLTIEMVITAFPLYVYFMGRELWWIEILQLQKQGRTESAQGKTGV